MITRAYGCSYRVMLLESFIVIAHRSTKISGEGAHSCHQVDFQHLWGLCASLKLTRLLYYNSLLCHWDGFYRHGLLSECAKLVIGSVFPVIFQDRIRHFNGPFPARKHIIPKLGHESFELRPCGLRIPNLDEGFPKPHGVGEGADTGLTTDFTMISSYLAYRGRWRRDLQGVIECAASPTTKTLPAGSWSASNCTPWS